MYPEHLIRMGRVSELALSPCETWLAVAVSRVDRDEARYVSDLWRVSLHNRDEPVQLTRGDTSDRSPRFRRDGALAFLSDRPGDPGSNGDADHPCSQVWLIPAQGGEPHPVTDEPLGVCDFRFAHDTGRLFIITDVFLGIPHNRQRDHEADLRKRGPSGLHYTTLPVRHWDYWLPQAAPHLVACSHGGSERTDLTPEANREHREVEFDVQWDVARDGSKAVIATSRQSPARFPDTALRIIDIASGEYTDMGVVANTTHMAPRFSPDGRNLACVRLERCKGHADRSTLWCFDVAKSADPGRPVAGDWNAWPELIGWTPDGTALIAIADTHGSVPVFRVDANSGQVLRITSENAGGSHFDIHVTGDSNNLVGVRHSFVQPPEPFRAELTEGAEPEIVARLSGFSAAEGREIATWESFTVAGDGGVPVQSFAVLPAHRSGPHPVLFWIHGGPTGQWADCWHWRWNPLVAASAGYAVILPNPRGSTGFGQEFIEGIWNNQWGSTCYRDVMAVVDAVGERADIDNSRMAAMGGSFGGYMANWIAVSTDRFRCLMSHAGIYSLASFCGATDYPAYMDHMIGLSQHQDLDAFERYSANRQLANWTTPTLIIHGERDYRVPVGQALQLFEALTWKGVDAELLVFPDENHWIQKPQNIRLWYRTVLDFAARHLVK